MTAMASRRVRVVLGAAFAIGAFAILRPWTVRPMRTSPPGVFDAAAYVAEAWPRVIGDANATAVDVAVAMRRAAPAAGHATAAGSRKAAFVKGRGVVTNVDLTSRVGVARVRVEGLVPPGEVVILLGPVLRGTTVRDATSFVRFTDFANQSDFAAVSNAFNERILQTVLTPLDPATLGGQAVTFTGAAGIGSAGAGAPLEITPVALQVGAGDRR
jgi:predicted lipoprotein